jgi:hypothetical protein
MSQDFLDVRPGEKVTADKWNQMKKAAAAAQILRGGDNTRITVTPHGTLINAKISGGWTNPWRVVAAQRACTVAPGTVNGEYPTLLDNDGNTKRLDEKPAPQLNISNLQLGPNNVGWIAIELKSKEDYRTIDTVKVVQCDFIVGSELATSNPFFFFGLPGIGDFKVRYPLARIHYFPESDTIDIFQVAMFNLNWTCKPPAQISKPGEPAQSSLPRHFFFPA